MDMLYNPLLIRMAIVCVAFGVLVLVAALLGRGGNYRGTGRRDDAAANRNRPSPLQPDSLRHAANRVRTEANDAEAMPPAPQKRAA